MDVLDRLEQIVQDAERYGIEHFACETEDGEALVRVARAAQEIVRREARSEYSSIYSAPGEFAELVRGPLAALNRSPEEAQPV